GSRPLAPWPGGATLRDFGKVSRHGCLLAQMQQLDCVGRTRRRTCWLILSLVGWRWTGPSPSSPHLASRKRRAPSARQIADRKLIAPPSPASHSHLLSGAFGA